MVAIALVAGVGIGAVRLLARGVLVVGVADAAGARLAAGVALPVAVDRRGAVAGAVVRTGDIGPVAGVAVVEAVRTAGRRVDRLGVAVAVVAGGVAVGRAIAAAVSAR